MRGGMLELGLYRRAWAVVGFCRIKHAFSVSVWQEGDWYIAQCVQVDVASQGATEDEALENLSNALELANRTTI